MPGELNILDTTGTRVTLDRYEPQEATEILGVWQAMDGNNVKQIQQLRLKTEAFADCMRTGYLMKNDAWYAIKTTIMKTLEYCMTATTIKEKEWEYIMAPVLAVGLPRAGLARTFPRDVLYRPAQIQGFGIFHPWYHQEIVHLQALLEHTQQTTITGQLFTTSLEQLRLEMGTPGVLTDAPFKKLKAIVTETWLKDLWEFADRFAIQIRDTEEKLVQHRTNDKFLMKEFIQIGCTNQELQQLNECRIFLHAVTLSDIVTADGWEITIQAWEGQVNNIGTTSYRWPRKHSGRSQYNIGNYWKLWRQTLERTVLSGGTPRGLKEQLLDWNQGNNGYEGR
jgi:hypothetical protein